MYSNYGLTFNPQYLFLFLSLLLLPSCSTDPAEHSQVWGHRGSKPGLFSYPRAITAGRDLIFAIDRTGRVQQLDLTGQFVRQWILEKVDNGSPTGMTIDAEGYLWIPDTHNSRILKYDLEGNLLH